MSNSIVSKLKSLAKLLVAAPLLVVAVHASAADDLGLVQPGKLMVATEGTFPPFSMRSPDGKLDGLEIRVMKEVAKRLHLTYTPVLTKWDSLLVGLQANQYDVISAAMDITPERQKSILFSDGWLESGGRIITPKGSSIHTAADLKGKNVGAEVSSTFAKLAQDAGANVKSYKSESDAMQDLVNGNLDAEITDAISGAYDIRTAHLPIVEAAYVSTLQKGFAFKKDKRNLVEAVNKALASMIADGTYAKLTTPLVGYSPAPKKPILTLPE